MVLEPFDLDSNILQQCNRANKLLHSYYKKASCEDELSRIDLARQLYQNWNKSEIADNLFPGVPIRSDFWYLVQIFALDAHISTADTVRPEEFYVQRKRWIVTESLFENMLWKSDELAKKKILSRASLETFLVSKQHTLLEMCGISQSFRIRLLSFPELLLLNTQDKWKSLLNTAVFLDGFRLQNANQLGLFGGTKILGGEAFVDCIWNDSELNFVRPILIAEEKP